MSTSKTKPILISSNFFWYAKEWIPYLSRDYDLKIQIMKQWLIIKFSNHITHSLFEEICKYFDIKFIETIPDIFIEPIGPQEKILILPVEVEIPNWNWKILKDKLHQIFSFLPEISTKGPLFVPIVQILLAGIARNVRVIGNKEHCLSILISHLNDYQLPLDELIHSYGNWVKSGSINSWENDFSSGILKYIPYSIFIHLQRHSFVDNKLIYRYLAEWNHVLVAERHFNSNTSSIATPYFISEMPLLSPKARCLSILQFFGTEDDLLEIEEYWRIYASLVLRTLGYSVAKMPLIEPSSNVIMNYQREILIQKIKKNPDAFIDSCVNSSVINTFKAYQNAMADEKKNKYKRYVEFYSLYRGGILERRLKDAEMDLRKSINVKLFKKRVQRRKRLLLEYLKDFLDIYSFIALEGIKLFKLADKAPFNEKLTTFEQKIAKIDLRKVLDERQRDLKTFNNYIQGILAKEYNLKIVHATAAIGEVHSVEKWMDDLYKKEIKNYMKRKWEELKRDSKIMDRKVAEIRMSHFPREIKNYTEKVWVQYLLDEKRKEHMRPDELEIIFADIKKKWMKRLELKESVQESDDLNKVYHLSFEEPLPENWIWRQHLLPAFPDEEKKLPFPQQH